MNRCINLVGVVALFFCGCEDRASKAVREMQSAEETLLSSRDDKRARSILNGYRTDRDPVIRANAVGFISRTYRGPDFEGETQVILSGLSDPDHGVRRAAVEGLAEAKQSIAPFVTRLIEMLKDGNVDSAWFAAEALGKAGQPGVKALPALIEALEVKGSVSGEPQLRVFAAKALGEMGELAEPVLPELKRHLNDEDREFREEVKTAIDLIQSR